MGGSEKIILPSAISSHSVSMGGVSMALVGNRWRWPTFESDITNRIS